MEFSLIKQFSKNTQISKTLTNTIRMPHRNSKTISHNIFKQGIEQSQQLSISVRSLHSETAEKANWLCINDLVCLKTVTLKGNKNI